MNPNIKEIRKKIDKALKNNIKIRPILRILYKAIDREYEAIETYNNTINILSNILDKIDKKIKSSEFGQIDKDLIEYKKKITDLSYLIKHILFEEMEHLDELIPSILEVHKILNITPGIEIIGEE